MRRAFAVFAALLALPSLAPGQDHAHGAPEKLGTVHFATSCSPKVAAQFDRAMALLHSFEFGASLRGFNEVLAVDSSCAMAQWGIAMSQWGNPMGVGPRPPARLKDGRQAADAARRLAARASDRERGYAAAVGALFADYEHVGQSQRIAAYGRAMEELAKRQPADTEAQIFYALALAASAPPTDKTYANQKKAGAILEALWAKEPDHPGLAHYIIHAYDAPPLAAHARAAAERYAAIAPSAAHALHMPSHTFTRVGLWDESVRSNQRSFAAATRAGSIAEALHASDYEMYALLQLGREQEARAVLDSLPELVRRFDPNAITGAASGSAGDFALAAIPARWALEREAWTEAAALQPRTTDYPWTEAMTYFARALGASRSGDRAKARAAIDSLGAIRQRLAAKGEVYWTEQVAIQQLGAQAWLDLAEERDDAALAKMREAATREDATEKSAVTPGPLAPSRELLGDMLMELGRADEAVAEYRAVLEKEPNRRHSTQRLASVVKP